MADDPEFSVLRRNAEWADTFGGASTNLAQRHRFAQDKEAYAEDLLRQQEAHLSEEARRNKTAQNFYFRQKEAVRKDTLDNFNRGIKQKEADWQDEIMPLKMETERARSDALRASETARLNKEKRDAEQTLRVVKDSDAFEEGVHSLLQQHRPGSREFAGGVLDLTAKHPYISSDLRKTWLKQADIDTDPDALMTDLGKVKDTHDVTIQMDSNGKWKAMAKPKVTEKIGTISTTTKEGDVRTTVREPLNDETRRKQDDAQRKQLEAEHAVSEAAMRKSASALTGKPDPTAVGELNAIKTKLGYDLLDSTTGKVIPKSAPSTSQPASSTESAATSQPSATDRFSLAKKALDDPSATDEHKAAAKKILGM